MSSGSIHKACSTQYIQTQDEQEYRKSEERAPNKFLEATYIFLQIQLRNRCFIHLSHHEFSMTE
jgi:hypothetical protein